MSFWHRKMIFNIIILLSVNITVEIEIFKFNPELLSAILTYLYKNIILIKFCNARYTVYEYSRALVENNSDKFHFVQNLFMFVLS